MIIIGDGPVIHSCFPSGGKLVTHNSESGRVDMELSTEIDEGYFYVYDAGNDGDLSGSEDVITLGGSKYIDGKTCSEIFDGYDLKENDGLLSYYSDVVYPQEKAKVIKSYVERYLHPVCGEDMPPHNDGFFGIWENFTKDETGKIVGFEVSKGNGFCGREEGYQGVVVTNVYIDSGSYPEGIELLNNAVSKVDELNEEASKNGISRSSVFWDRLKCEINRSYGRNTYEENCELSVTELGWERIEQSAHRLFGVTTEVDKYIASR